MVQLSFNGRVKQMLRLLLCIALFAFYAPTAFSQETTGSIRGTVKDPSGAAVAGATVTATSPALVRTLEATTDSEGFYVFPTLPTGVYTVSATQTGFSTVEKADINLQLGNELRLDIQLAVGNVTETVTVTAASEAIDITSSRTTTSLSEDFINTAPKGRNVHSILKAAPGVRLEPKAGNEGVGGISVDGASGAENAYIIDGVEVTDVRKGQLRRADSIPFEFVREVQVKSGGFEAEYGGATGGVVNVVTKSGTDEFHGEVAFSATGSALNSNTRGFYQRLPSNAAVSEFFRQREDDYRALYPGFSLGGPVLKQRLHFFTSYFPEFIRNERTLNLASGSQQTFRQSLLRHYGIARLDYAPTQKIQINTSFLWTPTKVTGAFPVADDRVAPAPGLDKRGGYTPSSSYSAAFTYTPTSKLILSARFGYKYLNDKGPTLNNNYTSSSAGPYGISNSPFIFYRTGTGTQTSPAVPTDFVGSNNFQNVASTLATVKDITTRHNLYLDAAYIARLFGQQHSLKVGYSLNRLLNDVESNYTNGRFDIFWGESFSRAGITDRGTYGYYLWEDGVRLLGKTNSRNQGFYVQDAWQAHPRLTLNLGVRFENEFLPSFLKEINGVPQDNPISFGWGDKVAPRLGGAWDVLGNGRWKLSASYGHYFDVMKYELARGSFGGDVWITSAYRLNNPAGFTNLGFANPGAAGALITSYDNRHIDVDANGQISGIDPDLKPYQQREFSVTSEHQLGSNTVFAARYVRKRLVHAIEDIGFLNPVTGDEVYTYGNPGFGLTSVEELGTAPSGDPFVPKAKREYDAVEFRFNGRFTSGFARNLTYLTSYTYSRLYGNYAGLANSDENGRSDPSVSRAFDLPQGIFDANGRNVYGRLATDRPHTFSFFGQYPLTWKAGTTEFSLSQVAYSGSPISSEATYIVPFFYNGRGDLGRTDVFTQTDVLVAHTIPLTERVGLKFDLNVQNLFNQAAVLNVNGRLNRAGNLPLTDDQFFAGGFDVNTLIGTGAFARNPIYGLPGTRAQGLTLEGSNAYQGIREIRYGIRLQF